LADRHFLPVRGWEDRAVLPTRKTVLSAGYDLAAAAPVRIEPGEVALVPTGLKAYMGPGEVLILAVRSSLAVRRRLALANGIGVIDADYVDNPENEGHILIALENRGGAVVELAAGERIAQALFLPYMTTTDDQPGGAREGGFGSTGR
jgi:dUTP pyrophosphatase